MEIKLNLKMEDLEESECWSCIDNSGWKPMKREVPQMVREDGKTCAVCHGFGSYPTDLGGAILKFVRKYQEFPV